MRRTYLVEFRCRSMKYPRFLRSGDRITVVAPSLMVTEETDRNRFGHAVSVLNRRGYETRIVDGVFGSDGSAGPAEPSARISQLRDAFTDGRTSLVALAKGGFGQEQIVDDADWSLLRDNPKWMQGYSDCTHLLFKYTVDHDVASVYSGNFGDFGMEPWNRFITENMEVLEGTRTSQEGSDSFQNGFTELVTGLEPPEFNVPTFWHSPNGDVTVRGRIIGGCMDVLESMCRKDTCDVPAFIDRYPGEPILWYMETYEMTSPQIREMFEMMGSKGWFGNVAGFVFGRPLAVTEDYEETVSDCLGKYRVPLIFGADIGHLPPRLTVVNGAVAEIALQKGIGSITYRFE